MENMKQKNFEAIKIYRLKEKIFNLKELLAECLFIVNDACEAATEEDEVLFYEDLANKISKELNIKKRKGRKK